MTIDAKRTWFLILVLGLGCSGEVVSPLVQARRLPRDQARELFLQGEMTSADRGGVAIILAGRFGATSLAWLTRALTLHPLSRWPDRHYLARAVGMIPGAKSRGVLLSFLVQQEDWSLCRQALKALALRRQEAGVREAIERFIAAGRYPQLVKEAGSILKEH